MTKTRKVLRGVRKSNEFAMEPYNSILGKNDFEGYGLCYELLGEYNIVKSVHRIIKFINNKPRLCLFLGRLLSMF